MSEISDNLTAFYREFEEGATGGVDKWKKWLAPRVQYMQRGVFPVEIGAVGGVGPFLNVLRLWHASIGEMRLSKFRFFHSPVRADEHSSAEDFYAVRYSMIGVYRAHLPGLKGQVRARRRRVEVPARDEVWLDRQGKIVRLVNTIDTSLLLGKTRYHLLE